MTPELYALAEKFGAATLHEAAGGIGALPSGIKPIDRKSRLAGRALTVQGPSGDNLWIHRALLAAQPGDVLVCAVAAPTSTVTGARS